MDRHDRIGLLRCLLAPDLTSEEVTSLLALALRRQRDKKVPAAHLMRLVVMGYIAKEGKNTTLHQSEITSHMD